MTAMTERTFSILKPDATARNLTGAVNKVIEEAGLRIVAQKRIRMSKADAERFYAVHKERPFFGELVETMTSGPVVVQVLEADGAIARYREIMGATNPAQAAEGTIRKLYAKSIGENSVHGSDAPETAKVEIAQFFPDSRNRRLTPIAAVANLPPAFSRARCPRPPALRWRRRRLAAGESAPAPCPTSAPWPAWTSRHS